MSPKLLESSFGQKADVNRKSKVTRATKWLSAKNSLLLYTLLLMALSIFVYQPLDLSAQKKLSDLRKDYAVVRQSKIPVRQKPQAQSKTMDHALFGHIMRTTARINPAHQKGLRRHDQWLPIRQKEGLEGYVRVKDVLLLDKNQYRLWRQNYTPYKVTSKKATATRQWLKVQRLFLSQHKKHFSLPQGAIVWSDKKKNKKVYFRDLSLRLNYTLAWLKQKHVKPCPKAK